MPPVTRHGTFWPSASTQNSDVGPSEPGEACTTTGENWDSADMAAMSLCWRHRPNQPCLGTQIFGAEIGLEDFRESSRRIAKAHRKGVVGVLGVPRDTVVSDGMLVQEGSHGQNLNGTAETTLNPFCRKLSLSVCKRYNYKSSTTASAGYAWIGNGNQPPASRQRSGRTLDLRVPCRCLRNLESSKRRKVMSASGVTRLQTAHDA